MRRSALSHSLAVLEPFEQADVEERGPTLRRYQTDPFAHLDDGHVRIIDLESLDETVLDPWPHQREIISTWIDLEVLADTGRLIFRTVHEEKSRQMGVSWIIAYVDLWATMYHDVPALSLSLDFTDVDDGGSGSTPDSYFGRIRYMHERMPEEFRAPIDFKYGLVKHRHRSRAFIVAEGQGPDPGRGKRYGRALIDEAARLRFGRSANAALVRAVPHGRFYNSTPHGEGNVYFTMLEEKPRDVVFIRHHWSEHPVYAAGAHIAGKHPNECALCQGTVAGVPWSRSDPRSHRFKGKLASPWYDDAILELTDEEVAQELDIDYVGSLAGRVYPEFSESVHVVDHIAYEPNLPIELSFDYGLDFTSVGIYQDGPELRLIGELEVTDIATPELVAPAIRETLADLGVPLMLLEQEWTIQMLAAGDPHVGRDLATGRTVVSAYRRLGFRIRSPKYLTVAQTILATKRLLLGTPKNFRVSASTCPLFIRHAKNNRRKTDRYGVPLPGPLVLEDDEHNHMMRSFAYYVTFKWPKLADPADERIREATERPMAKGVPYERVYRPRAGDVVDGGSITKARPGMKL